MVVVFQGGGGGKGREKGAVTAVSTALQYRFNFKERVPLAG